MCSASRFTSKVSRHWLRKSSIAALSVGNSCAGNKLMASTSSSVRWVSASNRRRLSISSSKSRGDKAVRRPSERDPTARRASRIRHAPSPDRHADNRRCRCARRASRDSRWPFSSPAHDHADSYADKRAASGCLPVQSRRRAALTATGRAWTGAKR